jgi:hypothetical protein
MNGELFVGVRPARPSPALRARVLAAADAAAERPAWWQGWGFGRWDLAWVAAVLVLLAVNVALGSGDRPMSAVAPPVSDREVMALARELGVPESLLRAAPGAGGMRQDEALLLVLDERI